MPRKTDARRAQLRESLIDIAEAHVARSGVQGLKARAIASEAGCAVGAIYTHFADMHALAMAVNGRTFAALAGFVTARIAAAAPGTAKARLITTAHAYAAFAAANTHLWRALFDVNLTAQGEVPDWYMDDLNAVFALIEAPIAELYPAKDPGERDRWVRTLFYAIHGIVHLSLENQLSDLPLSEIETMISELLSETLP